MTRRGPRQQHEEQWFAQLGVRSIVLKCQLASSLENSCTCQASAEGFAFVQSNEDDMATELLK